jgi:nucleoside-diphosphate-sugar epimerase
VKIGITGLRGFIGSSVSGAIKKDGHEVIDLDSFTLNWSDKPVGFRTDLDWVLHIGAATSITKSFEDPIFFYMNNINSTLVALDICRHSGASFLFMSSYVYGVPLELPIKESHRLSATNPYMGSKIIGEGICEQFCEMCDLPLTIFRGSNIYGDSKIPGRLINNFLESARRGDDLILNDPKPRRDYLYIKDFEDLVLNVILEKTCKTGIYNVGYGKSYSNIEVLETFTKVLGNGYKFKVGNERRKNDIEDSSIDVSLLKKTFNWQPKYSLEDGIRKLLRP